MKAVLLVPGLLVVVLALAAPASAVFSLTLTADPIEEPVLMGGTASSALTVTITVDQPMACAGGGDVTVELTVANVMEEDGFMGTVSPETLTFSWGAGLHGVNDTVGDMEQSESATFNVALGDNISRAMASHEFTVNAAYDGTQPEMCESTGSFAAADDSAPVRVEVEFPAMPENGNEMPNDEDDPDAPPPENGEENDGPAPGFALVVVAALLYAALRRRR